MKKRTRKKGNGKGRRIWIKKGRDVEKRRKGKEEKTWRAGERE